MIIERLKNKADTNELITKVLINRGYNEEIEIPLQRGIRYDGVWSANLLSR